MMGSRCAYCHTPLRKIDFYLERPEGRICSRCIVKYKICVNPASSGLGVYTENPPGFPEGNALGRPLSDPSMERALLRELENLLI